MGIKLKPHNEETYGKVREGLKESNRVAVVHPTGTGKMYIALKLLEENKDKKAVYLAPSIPILHDVKKSIFAEGMDMTDFPNLKRLTYQKLIKMSDEEIEALQCDIIVLDEFQFCGAIEYQKAVAKLIEKNPNASILGLSATPIRYSDGLRDMSTELFEGHVVSEMTLEEAIEQGILPETTYVSALYGYAEDLEKMKKKISKIEDEGKKAQAEALFSDLSKNLDENTENLPELFAKYMKNKTGKYIIFCESIEDMKEKMQQANKMFESVNPNITVRGVSSEIRETDRILTEFENDSDENTLKLLYAVDMLNTGYHLNDLAGVIMMRRTYSPGIFSQQLGRALSVGGEKTVVLDLVNNFDRCQIIADFAERMRQYKGKESTSEKKEKSHSRIVIHDNTKEFREIISIIMELSKTKIVLAEKIEIFERFAKTGETLTGNTIFEGYPIGQWAIQIRNSIKRENEGKGKGLINPTEEQLEKLNELGILDRQIEATIDEKIDMLIEWMKKYPKVHMIQKGGKEKTKEILRSYCSTEEEYQKLLDEYEKILRYYEYIRYRKYGGKLTEEQISRCKEGNIGGCFGLATEIESVIEKYGLYNEDAKYIISKYGTIEDFLQAFISGEIEDEKDSELASSCTINGIDIDKNPNSKRYENLIRAVLGRDSELLVFSSKTVDEVLESLTDREREIIVKRFGLATGEFGNLEEVGNAFGMTRERIRQYEAKALRKLRHSTRASKLSQPWGILKKNRFLTQDERDKLSRLDEIFTDIRLKNIDINDVDIEIEDFEFFMSLRRKLEIRERNEGREENEERIEGGETPVEELDLSIRTFNCLKRAGIHSLQDIVKLTVEELANIRNISPKCVDEVKEKLEELGLHLKGENVEELDEKETIQSKEASTSEKTTQTESQAENIEKTELGEISEEELMAIINENENNRVIKQESVQRVLEQQRIIRKQQQEIEELKRNRQGVKHE